MPRQDAANQSGVRPPHSKINRRETRIANLDTAPRSADHGQPVICNFYELNAETNAPHIYAEEGDCP
jgi:hypothetical protein